MNILVFLAGVSVGWVADKLYNTYIENKEHDDESNEAEAKDTAAGSVKQEQTKAEKSEGRKESSTKKKESSTKKKESSTEKESSTQKKSSTEKGDDLSQLKGVGPKLAEALGAIGIHSYKQLSETPVDNLLEQLDKINGRFSRTVITAVVERAKQAAEKR